MGIKGGSRRSPLGLGDAIALGRRLLWTTSVGGGSHVARESAALGMSSRAGAVGAFGSADKCEESVAGDTGNVSLDRIHSRGYVPPADELSAARLAELGGAIRRARLAHGLSQWGLESLALVDQTAISRLERGLAARFPVERLVRLKYVLGRELPLGDCPHDHACRWQSREPPLRVTRQWPKVQAVDAFDEWSAAADRGALSADGSGVFPHEVFDEW